MKAKQHHFNIELAVKIGVEKAVLMANIEFWLDWSKANNKNVHENYYWTYNSASAFAKLFPYMSKHTIGRHLKMLEETGRLISGNFNKAGYDRTKWYTTSDYLILQNCNMDIAELQTASCRSAAPIPYVNTNKNTNNNIHKTKPFSEEIEKGLFIDQLDFDDFNYCKSAMRFLLEYKKQLGSEDNIYAGSLMLSVWSDCESKLRSVASTHEEIQQLIYNIHQQKCTNQESVSLPFILHTNIMTDDEFAHVAINCESWIV